MRIRPASAGDVAAIEQLVERAYRVYVEWIGMRPGPMEDDYADRVARGLVTVAADDAIAGVFLSKRLDAS